MPLSGGELAASAKARLRRATLLREEDFAELLEQDSVGDIAVRLSRMSYARALKNFSLEGMRRWELEFVLRVAAMAESVAFRHYVGGHARKILDMMMENVEIDLFKYHFRNKMGTREREDPDDRILELISDFHLTLIDQEKLFAAATLKDILASVRKESLRAALTEALPRSGEIPDITARGAEFQKASFSMGMILDRHYFESLYAAVESLGGAEGRMLRMLVGTRVDLVNLYWIYRARRFFGMAPEESLTLITKARYRADFRLLTKVAFAEPSMYGQILKGTPYDGVFNLDNENSGLREVQIQRNMHKLLYTVVNRVFLAGLPGFQNTAAYLMLKEFESRDLIAVIESVRYGIGKNEAYRFLIRTPENEDREVRERESGD